MISLFRFATLAGMFAGFLSVGLAARAAEVPDAVLQAEQARVAAVGKAAPTAVCVFAGGGQGGGSAVVISPDGYALSNFHVTQPAGEYMKCAMADGGLYDAVLVGLDPTGDVALIKLLGRQDFPAAKLADSDQVRVGDWCFAAGNPFLLATDFQPTISYGIVSGVHRYQGPAGTLLEYADCLQTDAAINPGNSGGPLYNSDGDLIGINGRCSFEKRGRVNVGVGYSISINQIKNFLGVLHSGRIVDHATLGATVSRDEDGHVVVSDILDSSDVYRRGLRYGDEVLAIGGRSITTVNGLKNVVGIFPKGWRVPLSYRHAGQRHDVLVRLMGVHGTEELLEKVQKPTQQPKPKLQPKPKGGDKGPQPPEPQPMPSPHMSPKQAPPEQVQKFIQARKGYANYYFNELNRDRVWKSLAAHGDFSHAAETWKLSGTALDGSKVNIELGRDAVLGRFPGEAKVDLQQELGEQLLPTPSGGLLVALHLWQRFLRLGPQQFGEVVYWGTAPVLGRQGLYDVLIGTHDVVETRFFCDPQSGRLIGLEMWPEPTVDPCEVYFDDFRAVPGGELPHRMTVRHGDQQFAELKWERIEYAAGK